jgi:hypothetical protein
MWVESWKNWRLVKTTNGGRIETSTGIIVCYVEEKFCAEMEELLEKEEDEEL